MTLFSNFLFNIALLISMNLIGQFFYFKSIENTLIKKIVHGLIIGAIGIILMLNTVEVSPGIIIDTRSILVSVTGIFYGGIPAYISVLVISIYRVILGGAGAATGVLVTILTATTGVLWKKFRFNKIAKKKNNWLEFYLFGLITHMVMILCMFSLPNDLAIPTIKNILIPVIIMFPIGVFVLCHITIYWHKFLNTKISLEESESKFETLFSKAPIGIAIASKSKIIFVNSKLEEITGRNFDQMSNIGWQSFTHPDDVFEDEAKFSELNSGAISSYDIIKRYIRPDSSLVWVYMIIAAIKSDLSKEGYHISMAMDITDKINAEQELKKSESRYRTLYLEYLDKQSLLVALLDSIPDLIFYKDINSVYMGSNRAFREFVGRKDEEIIGKTDLDLFDESSATLFRSMDKAMLESKVPRVNEEEVRYPDGKKVTLETLKTPYYDSSGNNLGLIGISRDITERKKKEEEIIFINNHDALTGLKNRIFFENEINKLDNSKKLPYSIIVGDVNSMKLINNIYGHDQGDVLIKEIANLLKKYCRPNDIVARTGGDEFTIILPDTDSEIVKKILYSIIDNFSKYSFSNKASQISSISFGHTTKIKSDQNIYKLIREAEEHMYRRKLLNNKSIHSSLLTTIKTTVFEKSHETEAHAERMIILAKKVGVEFGLTEDELVDLELATTMHDLGKIGIDPAILTKQGKLSEEEWEKIRNHPEIGFRIAQTIPELYGISNYILSHHERWDGTGYPQGLSGEQIPLISRIISVVDSYDAMTEDRPYRKALSDEDALKEIENNSGTQFDPEIAELFITVYKQRYRNLP